MEQQDPSRRQYETYPVQQPPQQHGSNVGAQFVDPASAERFRQQQYLQQSPTSATPSTRGGSEVQQMYGYTPGLQYGSTPTLAPEAVQYAPGVQAQEAERHQRQQQQQQQYHQYGSNLMYGMSQPQSQEPTQMAYEQVQQYRPRSSAAPETVPTHFGVPQTGQYYLGAQAGPSSVTAPDLPVSQISPQYQQPSYPQPSQQSHQTYPGTMIDSSASGALPGYGQQTQYAASQTTQPLDQAFNDYQSRIRNIFTLVRNNTLREIDTQLLYISQYLLGNAETLGLTRDDDTLHDDRIRLWDEFNKAWLTTLQIQFDMTTEMIQTNQPLREPRSIMSSQSLEHLSRELVRMCDSIERHGLVDYQMGVAEEEVMDLLLKCLSLLEPSDEGATDPGQQAESSATAAARQP